MKKYFFIYALVVCVFLGCKDNSGLYGLLADMDNRLSEVERQCAQLNTNIEALQALIDAQLSGDYITAIVPIVEGGVEIGYTITFAKHDPITIYHGKDGQDGQNGTNGTNGQDGHTPIIGVAQDTDGVYYWTLDGEWLLDENGQKIRVTGENGQNGTNGTDGITPQLKIENDYWYISYDNGVTWTQLGKAKGEDGADGQDGDSMFQSVTQDDNYVYFTLIDGTTFKIAKDSASGYGTLPENVVEIENGTIKAAFSVSSTDKVYFSTGNLQYQASTNTWRFAAKQYHMVGVSNDNISSTYSGWIDLFGYGTSGYNNKYPYMVSSTASDYVSGSIAGTNYDWGKYNAISNGGNAVNMWRTLSIEEWKYVIKRTGRYSVALVNTVKGHVLLPDIWVQPDGIPFVSDASSYEANTYTQQDWIEMEKAGAVFLPDASYRWGTSYNDYPYGQAYLWSSSEKAVQLMARENSSKPIDYTITGTTRGCSVRLVKDVE